jgi:hypothetical protein
VGFARINDANTELRLTRDIELRLRRAVLLACIWLFNHQQYRTLAIRLRYNGH